MGYKETMSKPVTDSTSPYVPILFLTPYTTLAIGFVVPVHRGARSRGVAVWDRERSRGQVSQPCPAGGPGCAPGFETGWWPPALERFCRQQPRSHAACPPKQTVREMPAGSP